MADRLDVVIFGATGFTGKYTVLEGIKLLANLTWGVAGRNKEKLEEMLKEIGMKTGTDLSKIPIIIADIKDEDSLKKMCERAKVGPDYIEIHSKFFMTLEICLGDSEYLRPISFLW